MLKIIKMTIVCMLFVLSGCIFRSWTLKEYDASLQQKNYPQAAERLRRCIKSGIDERCSKVKDELMKYDSSIEVALYKKAKEESLKQQNERELVRLSKLRESVNPWDNLSLALEIQAGKIEKSYSNEDTVLIEKSFYGFGLCAKQNNPACMSQYAQMMMYGIVSLPKEKANSTKDKVMYWLNLSARYGNENARRLLLELEQPIPTPDLSMEILQKNANDLAKENILAAKESERSQAYYNSQMLEESRRQTFIASFNQIFPKVVNCTSNKVGSYVYTKCN